ncbi:MAG: hypothetical protein HY042_03025, partial [Spirochaetia bacterium]|nr:hypothetical protein [Spirochaetia bacterium]
WKGRSEEEIASELSISRGTVKSRAFRGRELLRKVLGVPPTAVRAAVSGSTASGGSQ